MADTSLITDDFKIRQFIETLTSKELVQLFQNVVTPEYIGLIAAELKKTVNEPLPEHAVMDPEFHSILFKEVNSPPFLVAISDYLAREVEEEVAEMMGEIPTHG